jgi:hypothetical protein
MWMSGGEIQRNTQKQEAPQNNRKYKLTKKERTRRPLVFI